jgi:ectoine hydroxylase-related dioxygenase (phytanoyl-CoA dioxygenase family)
MSLPDDLYSAIVRSERIVGPTEQLLRGQVYHLHHKMMLKEPRVGGAWEWHQDYGYWYSNGCLFPDMACCLIAVDRATRENGCLQVIRGSHRMGRIEHGKTGEQVGADQARVDAALERMELVYCEMEPGDALFFHGNLLHRSDQNRSEHPRWSLICCYNTRHNDPFIAGGRHPNYSPLEKWPDDRVRATLVGS